MSDYDYGQMISEKGEFTSTLKKFQRKIIKELSLCRNIFSITANHSYHLVYWNNFQEQDSKES